MSVVVPCYRYGHFVEAAVASIISQQGVDTEVIVVDDASPDGSADIVQKLAARHPNVIAMVHETNRGHIATYNDGLARATGEYVLLLSADDQLASGALARAVAVMQRFPAVGMVYGFAPSFLDVPPSPRRFLPQCVLWRGEDWLTQVCRKGQNPVSTPTAVMRRDLLNAVGGYDPALPHTADLLMWLRSAAKADVAYVAGVDQAYYRVHGANMHMTTFAQLTSDLAERREAFGVFSAERGDPRAGARGLRDATAALLGEAQAADRRTSTIRPSAIRAAWPAIADRVRWRYWRRFGLRL